MIFARAGDIVNRRYELQIVIGGRLHSQVWLATEKDSGTAKVIKFYDTQNTVNRRYGRHLLDLASAGKLTNLPFFTCPTDWGETDEAIFMVTQFLQGVTPASNLGALPEGNHPSIVLSVALQAGRAIAALHARSIVHSDVKPANMLVRIDGERVEAWLTDLGAVLSDVETGGATIIGTVRFQHNRASDRCDTTQGSRRAARSERVDATAAPTFRPKPGDRQLPRHVSATDRWDGEWKDDYRRDVYALGISLLDMFSAESTLTYGSSSQGIDRLLKDSNRWLAADRYTRLQISDLIARMIDPLHVQDMKADSVRDDLERLAHQVDENIEKPSLKNLLTTRFTEPPQHHSNVDTAPRGEPNLDFDVDTLAAQLEVTRKRIKTSWILMLFMALPVYLALIALLFAAVTLTLSTHKVEYATVLGGVSLPVFLGTLIWKPYEKINEATSTMARLDLALSELHMISVKSSSVVELRETFDRAYGLLVYSTKQPIKSSSLGARRAKK